MLVAAEEIGIVHRDLKPSNLMLLARGREETRALALPLVKVIDFGLAKAVDAAAQGTASSETRAGFVGTPAFASPEQFLQNEDAHIDGRADIYSLGVTLWYALCGRSPFSGRTLKEIYEQQQLPLPTGELIARRVPRPVIDLLASTLAPKPAKRPRPLATCCVSSKSARPPPGRANRS